MLLSEGKRPATSFQPRLRSHNNNRGHKLNIDSSKENKCDSNSKVGIISYRRINLQYLQLQSIKVPLSRKRIQKLYQSTEISIKVIKQPSQIQQEKCPKNRDLQVMEKASVPRSLEFSTSVANALAKTISFSMRIFQVVSRKCNLMVDAVKI